MLSITLSSLSLSSNTQSDIEDTITKAVEASRGHLIHLFISNNSLQTLPHFSNSFVNLQAITLDHNSLSQIDLNNPLFRYCRTISLRYNEIHTISNLHLCRSVETLHLDYNNIKSISDIHRPHLPVPSIKSLHLEGNPLRKPHDCIILRKWKLRHLYLGKLTKLGEFKDELSQERLLLFLSAASPAIEVHSTGYVVPEHVTGVVSTQHFPETPLLDQSLREHREWPSVVPANTSHSVDQHPTAHTSVDPHLSSTGDTASGSPRPFTPPAERTGEMTSTSKSPGVPMMSLAPPVPPGTLVRTRNSASPIAPGGGYRRGSLSLVVDGPRPSPSAHSPSPARVNPASQHMAESARRVLAMLE
eukprot:gnl/Dysnectes_brevis/10000_a19173_167.p1 GENE.gnl/Dysnectes_brevis/10000_a19173_167~~gnl/Dysnectes_brevis/10000_a19173_167.p1  ORF type:complete len:359 (+),score=49.08 gnl/Dysnectes_brevis/10000_a19173_167:116-1192(+)